MDGGASRARWPPSGCCGAARVPGRNTVRRHARRGGPTSADVPVVRGRVARRAAIRRGRGGDPSSGATAPLDDRMAPPRALASRRRIRRRARGARGGRPAASRRDRAAAHEPGARGRAGHGARAAFPVARNTTADGAPAGRGATGGRRLARAQSAAAPPPKLDLHAQSIAIPVTEPFGPTGLEVRIRDRPAPASCCSASPHRRATARSSRSFPPAGSRWAAVGRRGTDPRFRDAAGAALHGRRATPAARLISPKVLCYRGGMDLANRSRAELAVLGREYMLFGHLLNRAALPHVHMQLGAEAREAIAIEEWMGASPVYTRRMQRAMGFAGDDVETIFKGFQLDVGFPHQYMDVRYRARGRRQRGAFWLPSCGALLEVEQLRRGRRALDVPRASRIPTFDATRRRDQPARALPADPPPAAHAGRSHAALPLGGVHRSRRRADAGDRRSPGGCARRGSRASRSRRARRRRPAAGTTTAARSIPTSASSICRAPRWYASAASSWCRTTCWCAR